MIAGDVLLLNFPFSDLSGAKLRPVVVLAVVDREDFVVCQIMSQRRKLDDQASWTFDRECEKCGS